MSAEMTPEEAYAEAERRIEEARRGNASLLDVTIPAPETTPANICDLDYLKLLDRNRTQITDRFDIRGMTGL